MKSVDLVSVGRMVLVRLPAQLATLQFGLVGSFARLASGWPQNKDCVGL